MAITTASKVQSPAYLAHVVLRTPTPNFEPMLNFYLKFLGAEVSARKDNIIAFIRYDDEHHRIALIGNPPGPTDDPQPTKGMHHMAFTFTTLDDLANAYTQRKAYGVEPIWCVNHGPTTSMYYKDPDGNLLETQVDNFDTPEQANDFMASEEFAENTVGADFNPEDLIHRLASGESHASIKKRPNVGPRVPTSDL